MPLMFMAHGWSACGKSTVVDYLANAHNCRPFHPIRFLKSQLEYHYDLSPLSLDTSLGKSYVPPGAKSSMQEIMVDIYHFWRKHDPQYSTRNMRKELPLLLREGNVALQAIRNPDEVEVILDLQEQGHSLIYIYIDREGAAPETSDEHMYQIDQMCTNRAAYSTAITNNGSFEDLYKKVDAIYKKTKHLSCRTS